MIDSNILNVLNDQVNKEFYSAYLYLEISNYFSSLNLDGFTKWYRIQALEEQDHAMKIINYIISNNEKPILKQIDSPNIKIDTPIYALESAFKHEQYITSSINEIYSLAISSNDFRTMKFLDWFIEEQAEEEETAGALINKFNFLNNNQSGLYILNQELDKRSYERKI